MGHKSAQVVVKVMLFSCLAISLSWLVSGIEVHADGTASIIIKLANGADVSDVAADYDAIVVKTLPSLELFLLESNLSDLAAQLTADTRVIAVYEDTAIEGQPRYGGAFGNELDAEPWGLDSDPATAFTEQWAIANIRLAEAHGISQGEGVTVAVLDTGVDLTHEQLQGKLVAGYDFVDDDAVPAEERDGLDQDGDIDIDEGAGHGTHVAGIVALTAPQAQIMPIRIFDDEGRGLYFDLVAGIMYAVDNGADVINLSGSGPEDASFLAEAIAYAEAQGVVVIAAGAVNSFGYPASYDSVISVGAADELNYPTDFSNFPEILDNTVYAPGFSIISGYDDGSYAIWTGNSMATPFVAGSVALLLATDACDTICAKTVIVETAHPVVDDPESTDYYGRIDAFDAVSVATNQYHADLSVLVMDGDLGERTNDEQIKPYFNIVNKGNSLPLSEVTLRYWFNRDGNSSQQVMCDYAAVACNAIEETFTTTETAVADTYLELSFAPDSGTLLGNHDTGNIQLRIHKTDWQAYDELDDYSYNSADSFTENQQVTLYQNGQLIWGEEPSEETATPAPVTPTSTPIPTNTPAPTSTPVSTSAPPTSTPSPTQTAPAEGSSPEPTTIPPAASEIRAQYRAFDTDAYNNNLRPQLQLVNDSSSAIPLSELRLRYWFTDEETAVSQAYCDYAAIGTDKITAVTGNIGIQHYVDVTFSEAAGELEAGSNSGEIFLRIHHDNWTLHDESDDYSFSSGQTNLIDWQNVALYHNNTLIWGIEP